MHNLRSSEACEACEADLGGTQVTVRVKDGMSLRNGIYMRNTIYVGNKLTEEHVMFSHQFYKSSSFFDAADSC